VSAHNIGTVLFHETSKPPGLAPQPRCGSHERESPARFDGHLCEVRVRGQIGCAVRGANDDPAAPFEL
jgi:hypothetical protein